MEPEWNHSYDEDDATMLGIRNKTSETYDKFMNMHFGWLKNRDWSLRFSLLNRMCYISGKSLQYCLAYRGRKSISGLLTSHKKYNDDIWISPSEYLKLVSNNKIA